VLPIALHPLSVSLDGWLQEWFFPPMPEQVTQIFRVMSTPSLPLWTVVLAMAVAPGVCEELAFRGFILSGFGRSARPAVAIVISSVAFGVAHMVPQQVFNAAMLGLVLGLIAVRSGSLLPGVLFHIIYNSLEILRARATSLPAKGPLIDWFMVFTTTKDNEHVIEYRWPALALAAVVACVLITWLIRSRSESASAIQNESDMPSRRERSPSPPAQPPVAMR
jgi:sodium transport system permease protein